MALDRERVSSIIVVTDQSNGTLSYGVLHNRIFAHIVTPLCQVPITLIGSKASMTGLLRLRRNMKPERHQTDLVTKCPQCEGSVTYVSLVVHAGNYCVFECRCDQNHTFNLTVRSYESPFVYVSYWEGQVDYKEYIKSPEWKQKAEVAKEKAGWKCQVCNKDGNRTTLHAHHRTYNNLGDEKDGDIIVLCAKCHGLFHDKECL